MSLFHSLTHSLYKKIYVSTLFSPIVIYLVFFCSFLYLSVYMSLSGFCLWNGIPNFLYIFFQVMNLVLVHVGYQFYNWYSLNTYDYGTIFGGMPGSFNSWQIDAWIVGIVVLWLQFIVSSEGLGINKMMPRESSKTKPPACQARALSQVYGFPSPYTPPPTNWFCDCLCVCLALPPLPFYLPPILLLLYHHILIFLCPLKLQKSLPNMITSWFLS